MATVCVDTNIRIYSLGPPQEKDVNKHVVAHNQFGKLLVLGYHGRDGMTEFMADKFDVEHLERCLGSHVGSSGFKPESIRFWLPH